jgi:hypothetical protein
LLHIQGLFDYSFTKEEQEAIHDWSDFVSIGINPQLKHTNLTQAELQEATASAFRRYYLTPRGVWDVFRSVDSWNEFKELSVGAYGMCLQIGTWMKQVVKSKSNESSVDPSQEKVAVT